MHTLLGRDSHSDVRNKLFTADRVRPNDRPLLVLARGFQVRLACVGRGLRNAAQEGSHMLGSL